MTSPLLLLFTGLLIIAGCWATAYAAQKDANADTAKKTKVVEIAQLRRAAEKVYKARSEGMRLYADEKYDEAYPHLMLAAQSGLKFPQAQLGFMHVSGLGPAAKDPRLAIGWLGVASAGKTDPSIRKFYKKLLKSVPKDKHPGFQRIVDKFVTNYGTAVNNVQCARVNKAASHIRTLQCTIRDPDGRIVSDIFEGVQSGQLGAGAFDSIGGGGSPGAN